MAVSARSTISGALKLINVLDPAETLSSADADDGLLFLNNMVDAFNLESLSLFSINEVVASFAGSSATIGPGMQINIPRPTGLERGCFYRRSGIDYPLTVIDYDQYNSISLKTVNGDYPDVIYYDGNSPTAKVFVWPVPSLNEYHLQVANQFTRFSALDDSVQFPQGYAKYLMYALAVELAAPYSKAVPPSVMGLHVNMTRALKRSNSKTPTLNIDLFGNSGNDNWRINILSNQP